jgi:DNA-binding CsgD family transcriptional regulator
MSDHLVKWAADSVPHDKHSLLWAGACALAACRHPDRPTPDSIGEKDALTVQQAIVSYQMRASIEYPVAILTLRQQQVLDMVAAGQANKVIAFHLGISQRIVENHRCAVMKRTDARSLPGLTRVVITAAISFGTPQEFASRGFRPLR